MNSSVDDTPGNRHVVAREAGGTNSPDNLSLSIATMQAGDGFALSNLSAHDEKARREHQAERASAMRLRTGSRPQAGPADGRSLSVLWRAIARSSASVWSPVRSN
jgi:hypothetical protein